MPSASPLTTRPTSDLPLLWDVFCRVIDNFGDLGICWRLCADLAARGHTLRLWVDDTSALQWMAPGALDGAWPGIQVLNWEQSHDTATFANMRPADVWIEGFGCEIAPEFIAHHAYFTGASGQFSISHPVWINLEYLSAESFVERSHGLPSPVKFSISHPAWINLEYLSAESFVERSHGLPSPVMGGPAKGWTKYFFYPGFTAKTGGLLREPHLMERQQVFTKGTQRQAWLARHGLEGSADEQWVSLFCYEPAALPALLAELDASPKPTHLLVTSGRASAAVHAAVASLDRDVGLRRLRISHLPALTQADFDHLLWLCDLNCVRGEDSIVRAIWAGKPLVWQIYPQQDAAHIPKLDAFLDMLESGPALRAFHHAWNAPQGSADAATLPALDLPAWSQTVHQARARLLQMDDLSTQLLQFVQKKR